MSEPFSEILVRQAKNTAAKLAIGAGLYALTHPVKTTELMHRGAQNIQGLPIKLPGANMIKSKLGKLFPPYRNVNAFQPLKSDPHTWSVNNSPGGYAAGIGKRRRQMKGFLKPIVLSKKRLRNKKHINKSKKSPKKSKR